MAKTKEQVLAMNLTATEKKRAEDYFKSNERFGRPSEIDCNSVKEVKEFLADLQKNYEARKKADERRNERLQPYYELKKFIVTNKNYISRELVDSFIEKVEVERMKANTKPLLKEVKKLLDKGISKDEIHKLF